MAEGSEHQPNKMSGAEKEFRAAVDPGDLVDAVPDEHDYLAKKPPEEDRAYDNVPMGSRSSNPGKSEYKWHAEVSEVDPELRDKWVVEEPMERIMEMVQKHPKLSFAETRRLVKAAKTEDDAGIQAREKLILHNMYMAVAGAKRYYRKGRSLDVPMEDLTQEGMKGVVKGVDGTEIDKLARQASLPAFIKYAVNQEIQRFLDQKGYIIRPPYNQMRKSSEVRRIEHELTAELGRKPTVSEIAEQTSWFPVLPDEVRTANQQTDEWDAKYPEAQVRRASWAHDAAVAEVIEEITELQAVTGVENIDSLLEQEKVPKALVDARPTVEQGAEKAVTEQEVEALLSQLSDRERRVLEKRYGVNGEPPRTLDEVGRTFNVTRERIRQLENQSLKKLQAFSEMHRADHMLGIKDLNPTERQRSLQSGYERLAESFFTTPGEAVDVLPTRQEFFALAGQPAFMTKKYGVSDSPTWNELTFAYASPQAHRYLVDAMEQIYYGKHKTYEGAMLSQFGLDWALDRLIDYGFVAEVSRYKPGTKDQNSTFERAYVPTQNLRDFMKQRQQNEDK